MLGFCLSYEGENYFTLIAGVKIISLEQQRSREPTWFGAYPNCNTDKITIFFVGWKTDNV